MSLAKKAVRGAVWTVVTSVLARFLGVVGTVALAYFLTPAVIGEVTPASVLALSAGQLSLIGFGQYLVARRDLDRRAVFQLTLLTNGLALIVLVGLCAIALPIAAARGDQGLYTYLPGFALSVFLAKVGIVPERLLVREMRFGYIGMIRTLGEVTYAVVAVALAALGWGGQSVVMGQVASSAIKLVLFAGAVPWRAWLKPHPIDRARIRDVLRFGGPLWLGTNAQFVARNYDNLVIGGLFGDTTMGLYKQAYNLADIPTATVGEGIGDVLLPSFTRVDDAAKARGLVRATGLLALIVFPLAVGLGAVAPTLVAALLPADWQGVAPFLTVLAALSVTRPVGWIIASYLQARGSTRTIMVLELGRAAAVLLAIVGLSVFGPLAAAGGIGLAFGLHALASMWAVNRLDGVSFTGMLGSMVGPLVACSAMVAAVLGVRTAVELHPVPQLLLEVVVGAAVYLVACFVVARRTTFDALQLLATSFGRRRPAR